MHKEPYWPIPFFVDLIPWALSVANLGGLVVPEFRRYTRKLFIISSWRYRYSEHYPGPKLG